MPTDTLPQTLTLCPERVEFVGELDGKPVHLYVREGKSVPGVSSILRGRSQPWLPAWKLKMARREIVRALTGSVPPDKGVELDRWQYGVGDEDWRRREGESYRDWCQRVDKIVYTASLAADRKSKLGRDAGTELHEFLEGQVKDHMIDPSREKMRYCPPEFCDAVDQFGVWERKEEVCWLYSERRVFCEADWYAGKLDFLAYLPKQGRTVLGDFKTNATISEEWSLTTAAYQHAAEEEVKGGKVDGRIILRFLKGDGGFKVHEVPSPYEYDLAGFLAARTIARWNNFAKDNRWRWTVEHD